VAAHDLKANSHMTYTSPNLLHNRCNPAMFVAPIDVDGWPTSKAALKAYGPKRLKTSRNHSAA